MAFEHKEGQGSVFTNRRKDKPEHADFTGDMVLNGVAYWVNVWTTDKNGDPLATRDGDPYYKLTFRPKNPPLKHKEEEPRVARPSLKDQLQDEVPF